MGAPPVWPGAPDEDVLETGRPLRRGALPVIVVLTLATLAAVAGVVVSRHHPHPSPVPVTFPTAPAPAPSVVHARRTPVADVLLPATPTDVAMNSSHGMVVYWTTLRNATERTIRLGTPLLRAPHLLALPGTDVVLSPGQPRDGAEPDPRRVAHTVAAHALVTVTVLVWPSCSVHRDDIARVAPRRVHIIVPIAGYRRAAVYSFGSLYSGLRRPRVGTCRATDRIASAK